MNHLNEDILNFLTFGSLSSKSNGLKHDQYINGGTVLVFLLQFKTKAIDYELFFEAKVSASDGYSAI